MSSNYYRAAINTLKDEKGLPIELIVETVTRALLDIYRKTTHSSSDDIQIVIDKTGEVHILVLKRVVAVVSNPAEEIALANAQRLKANAALGEMMPVEAPELLDIIPPRAAGQLILQRMREAEQAFMLEQFKDRINEIVLATVQRPNGDDGFEVQIGEKLEGIISKKDMIPGERYRQGQRIRVYVLDLKRIGGRSPQAIVSRSHPDFVKRLFEQEVPEMSEGTVELKGLVREAGSRSKVAVWARQSGVDPVGACVGVRGSRINNIVNELGGEKIDIIPWDPDPSVFVSNALSPAKPIQVDLRPTERTAFVTVPEKQLSLAIGQLGQNARLAAKLTGWRIDVSKPGDREKRKEQNP